MKNSNNLIQRYERKWIINHQDFNQTFIALKRSNFFFQKQYEDRNINSIYFDDNFFSSIKQNLDGIAEKKKYRVRWYGSEKIINNPIFEIKSKKGFLVKKKHFNLDKFDNNSETNDKNYITKLYNYLNKNFKFKNEIKPILSTHYLRSYFISSNELIRATLDRNIKSQLFAKFQDKNLYKGLNNIVLELKYDINLDEFVRTNLKNISLLLTKNSKYINSATNKADFVA